MARVATISKLQAPEHRKSREARNGPRRNAWPNDDVLTQQTLGNRNTASPEEALKRVPSLPPIRQGKVLDIRRQIAEGTYEVVDRLDEVIDRVLEALTT